MTIRASHVACFALLVGAGCAAIACAQRRTTAPTASAPDGGAGDGLDPAEAEILAAGFRDLLEAMAGIVQARGGAACVPSDAGVASPGDARGDAGRCADCAGMAADLGALFDRSEPLFERARAVRSKPADSEVFDAAMRRQGSGVQLLVESIAAGLGACVGTPELVRTVERMPVL